MLTLQSRSSSVVSDSHSLQSRVVACVSTVQSAWRTQHKLLALLCQHSRRTEEQLADLSVVILPVVVAIGDSFCSAQAV